MRVTLLPLLSLALVAGPLSAQATPREGQEKEDALAQELTDLLNIQVTVASKRAEKTTDAAATVTAYTAATLDKLGTTTLGDLANITPGYGTFRIYGEQVFETRGQKAGSFNNNRHLLLVDGIPVHHARNYKAFTEEEMPLQFAERVEFLRGPASSLYGIGAFFGVVSITPKSSPSGTRVETRMGGGSDASTKRFGTTLTHGTSEADTLVSMSYFNKGDSLAPVGTIDDPDNRYRDGRNALFMMVSHKLKEGALQGLTVGSILSYKTGNLGENWNWGAYTSPVNSLTWATFIPYLKLERKLATALTFHSYLKYNESQEKGSATPFTKTSAGTYQGTGTVLSLYDIRVANYELLGELQWAATPTLDVVAGLNYDVRWQKSAEDGGYNINISADAGAPYPGVPVKKTGDYRTTSAYIQAKQQIDILSGMHVTGGLRLDKGDAPGNSYSQVSPRIGIVQRVTEHCNLKALYGTALRGPGIKEVELNTEKKLVYPDLHLNALGAETFNTLELAATYTATFFSSSLTWFTNRTTNTLDPSPSLHGAFTNSSGTTKASGVEIEVRFATPGGWQGWVNGSSAKAEGPTGQELDDVPVATGSAGLTYSANLGVPLQASAIVRHRGAFRVANPLLPRPEGGTFVDLRLALSCTPSLVVSLEGRNLTDKIIRYPKAGLPDVPSPGRDIRVDLHLTF